MQAEPKVVRCKILILAVAQDANVEGKFYLTFKLLEAPDEVKESAFFHIGTDLSGYTFDSVDGLKQSVEASADVVFQGSPSSRNYQLSNFSTN